VHEFSPTQSNSFHGRVRQPLEGPRAKSVNHAGPLEQFLLDNPSPEPDDLLTHFSTRRELTDSETRRFPHRLNVFVQVIHRSGSRTGVCNTPFI
jgi:hypothetical protein